MEAMRDRTKAQWNVLSRSNGKNVSGTRLESVWPGANDQAQLPKRFCESKAIRIRKDFVADSCDVFNSALTGSVISRLGILLPRLLNNCCRRYIRRGRVARTTHYDVPRLAPKSIH